MMRLQSVERLWIPALSGIEVPLNSPRLIESIRRLRGNLREGYLIGAGTVTAPEVVADIELSKIGHRWCNPVWPASGRQRCGVIAAFRSPLLVWHSALTARTLDGRNTLHVQPHGVEPGATS